MRKEPICPYCGCEMVYPAMGCQYECPHCGSKGPDSNDQEEAYAETMQRYAPPEKPLTLDEIFNDPVWFELKTINNSLMLVDIVPAFSDPGNKAEIEFLGKSQHAMLPYNHYGMSWRCWAHKPTDEERGAAKWTR